MPEAAERVEVRPQQVWADNDPREQGRTLLVVSVGQNVARCQVLTPADGKPQHTVGRTRMIALDRFRPTSNGYKYLRDWEGPTP